MNNTKSFTIYDASAGSGKTYTLTKEYLKILLSNASDDAYKKILAITFTNKAVAEMKSRIISSLYEFSKPIISEKHKNLLTDIKNDLELSQEVIQQKSKNILKSIIHNYTAFSVLTIDKFTHKVIRTFAQDLGLPPDFEVSVDGSLLLQEAVDFTLSQVGHDPEITDLLVQFTKEKANDDKSWDVSKDILDVAQLLLVETHYDYIEALEKTSLSEFANFKKQIVEKSKQLETEVIQQAQEVLTILENNNIDNSIFSYGTFPNHYKKIVDGTFKIDDSNKFLSFENIAIKKNSTQRDLIETLSPEIVAITKDIYENFSKIFFYKAFLSNSNALSLLNTIHSAFKNIQKDKNIVSISNFNKIISNEIKNQPAPFIYERLGSKYRHFFIDEFQDTSEMQWLNLFPLLDNALSSEENNIKGTLLIVGDPKQSIYRWRGGKAEQFIDLSKNESIFSNPEKEAIYLDTNYRSCAEIIHFNNSFFKFLSNEFTNEDYKHIYAEKAFQKTNASLGGYINLSFIDPSEINDIFSNDTEDDEENDKNTIKENLYLEKTIAKIEDLIARGYNYKDIVILIRRKKHGFALANSLSQTDIPIESSETLLIQNATEVQFIVHVLRYNANHLDKISKAKVLYYIANHVLEVASNHEFLKANINLDAKSIEDNLKMHHLFFSFSNSNKKSLFEIVENIIRVFFNHKSTMSYIQYFLDLVLELDTKQQASVLDFLEYWDKTGYSKSIPSPEGNNAIKIMTIHKAKGLEFPVVIYPFAEEDFSRSRKDKIWAALPELDAGFGIEHALINHTITNSKINTELQHKIEVVGQESIFDAINVLYVALTRAEKELHIISATNTGKNKLPNNLSSYFISYLQSVTTFDFEQFEYSFGEPFQLLENNSNLETINNIEAVANVLNPNKIKIAQREALMWDTKQKDSIEQGNIIHEIASYIEEPEDIELAIQKSIENGLISSSDSDFFKEIIGRIVNHPELTDYFNGEGKVYNEKTILNFKFGNIKPDKVVIIGNQVLLLDFKTGVKEPKHDKQIETYSIALQEMGFNVVKKALVYTKEEIEVVFL